MYVGKMRISDKKSETEKPNQDGKLYNTMAPKSV